MNQLRPATKNAHFPKEQKHVLQTDRRSAAINSLVGLCDNDSHPAFLITRFTSYTRTQHMCWLIRRTQPVNLTHPIQCRQKPAPPTITMD